MKVIVTIKKNGVKFKTGTFEDIIPAHNFYSQTWFDMFIDGHSTKLLNHIDSVRAKINLTGYCHVYDIDTPEGLIRCEVYKENMSIFVEHYN